MIGTDAFGDLGYHLEEGVIGADELERLRAVAESVAERVATHAQREGAGPEGRLADGHRIQFSSKAGIQWEWADGSQAIRLIEPADHLDPRIDELFRDPRLTRPAQEALHTGDIGPFTSKLNFKRATEGSEFPWHQDYPYWYTAIGDAAQDVVTAIVFLDDATAANGALRVLPRSHLRPLMVHELTKQPGNLLTRGQEITEVIDDADAVTLELAPGQMSLHDVRLAHASAPNDTEARRVGYAIRYVAAHVRNTGTRRDSALLVRGVDRFHHFDDEPDHRVSRA